MEKKLITVKLDELIPYENNPRKNKRAVHAVSESIRQTGYNNPIIVDEDLVILAGHTRRMSLLERGETTVKVLQITGLSDKQKRKFRLLDNKVGEYSTWDFVALSEELSAVDFEGLELDWGLDFGEPDETGGGEKKEKGKTEYDCPACGFHFSA